uniref:Recoverin-visinin-Y n=1 Tax=Mordacia mordax TaxID=7755 RepID=A0A3G1TK60_MORMR|nr:recoverin-visinin-Y [Mordacia mordax]
MGNNRSAALSKELIDDLTLNTEYSEQELTDWYSAFLKQCPDSRISRERFEQIYSKFFPNADATRYAQHVFRSFDTNNDGTLDFREYVVALHLTSSGKIHLKLEWAFSLYDIDGNGTINKAEVLEIITAIFRMIPPEEQRSFPEDEDSPEKRTEKLWNFFGKKENDNLTEGEFVEGVKNNIEILRLIQYEKRHSHA